MSAKDDVRALCVQQLAAAMRAGVPAARALSALATSGPRGVRDDLSRAAQVVEAGGTLGDGLAGGGLVPPPLARALRGGPEASPPAVQEVADVLLERASSESRLRAATLQARLSLGLLGVVSLVLIVVCQVFAAGENAEWRQLVDGWTPMLTAVAALSLGLALLRARLWVALAGGTTIDAAHALRSAALLLGARVEAAQALSLAASFLGAAQRKALVRAAQSLGDRSPWQALVEAGVVDADEALRIDAVAAATSPATSLASAGARLHARAVERMDRVLAMSGTVAMVTAGLLVLWVMGPIYQSLFNVAAHLKAD